MLGKWIESFLGTFLHGTESADHQSLVRSGVTQVHLRGHPCTCTSGREHDSALQRCAFVERSSEAIRNELVFQFMFLNLVYSALQ